MREGGLSPCFSGKLYLRRVRLYGDYDGSGRYWGSERSGLLYYWTTGDDVPLSEYHDGHLRAWDRNAAKATVLRECPHVRFFR